MRNEGMSKELWSIIKKFVGNKVVLDRPERYRVLAASLFKEIKDHKDLLPGANGPLKGEKCKQVIGILSEENYLVRLDSVLDDGEIFYLENYYKDVVEFCLDLYGQSIAMKNGLCTQPRELTKFCVEMLSLNINGSIGAKVYNPFGGLASYAIENRDYECYGEELDRVAWAFMQIRLDANRNKSQYALGNSFKELGEKDNTYDVVITTPPFFYERGTAYNEFDIAELAMENKLKDGGKLLMVMPMSFCFGKGKSESRMREYLLNNGYLTSVIALPKIFLPITSVSTCLVVAEKQRHERFVLIDGSSYGSKNDAGEFKFEYKSLLDAIRNGDEAVVTKPMASEDVVPYQGLTPMAYLLPELKAPEGYNKVKLGDLAESVRFEFRPKDVVEEGRWVQTSNLSNDELDAVRYPKDFPVRKMGNMSRICDREMLLLSNIRNLKPTVLKGSPDDVVYISPGVFAFTLREDAKRTVSMEYLAYAIARHAYRLVPKGVTIPRIDMEQLMNMELLIPSLDVQEKELGDAKREKDSVKKREENIEDLMRRREENIIKALRGKRHKYAPYINNAYSAIRRVMKHLKENGEAEEMIDGVTPRTVEETLKLGMIGIEKLSEFMVGLTDVFEKDYGEASQLDLVAYFKRYETQNVGENYRVEFDYQEIENESDAEDASDFVSEPQETYGKEDVHAYVMINENDFTDLVVNQIVSNAKKHGFIDANRKDYSIRIKLGVAGGNYVVSFSNNGAPMNKEIDVETFRRDGVAVGATKGEGIGGRQIYNTIEHFGGSMEIRNGEEVTFIVKLPIAG
jgi:hypothetical protein